VPVRILHVSDLHAGANDAARGELEDAVRDLAAREQTELVVASGDLSHRNRRTQHERSASFLRSLGPPVLAVPGNHDIPSLPPARLARPFAAFRGVWNDTEPIYRSDGVVACGLNSVRPWLYQEGALRRRQLEVAARAFAAAPPGALRVAVLHHHLVSAPWRTAKRPLARRTRVLAFFAEAGADLVLSGHVHQSAVVERREFEVAEGMLHPLAVAIAPGLSRPRPHRRGEASGLHVYEATAPALRVLTYAWNGRELVLVADRRFPRGTG
jgi:3',5'-cyclic AMP phosphodiesterase CpdA